MPIIYDQMQMFLQEKLFSSIWTANSSIPRSRGAFHFLHLYSHLAGYIPRFGAIWLLTFHGARPARTRLYKWIEKKNIIGYVAEDASEVVGFVSGGYERHGDDIYNGEICALCVLTNHQRQGNHPFNLSQPSVYGSSSIVSTDLW